MLLPLQQTLLVDFVVVCITVVFGFAIVSTLMAVGKIRFHRDMFSNESSETTKSGIARKKCIAWAKKNGKVAK